MSVTKKRGKQLLKTLSFVLLLLTITQSYPITQQAEASLVGKENLSLKEGEFILLKGKIDDVSTSKAAAEILSSKSDNIIMVISSNGGSILAGMQLIQIMKDSGKNIKCVATTAISMAFVIFQACNERIVVESSILMQHVASMKTGGDFPNVLSLITFLKNMINKMEVLQADRLGIPVNDFLSKTRNDWWLLGEDAVSEKAADKLVSVTCDSSLASKKIIKKVQFLFASVEVTYSSCPLIESPIEVKISKEYDLPTEELQRDIEKFINSLYYRKEIENKLKID